MPTGMIPVLRHSLSRQRYDSEATANAAHDSKLTAQSSLLRTFTTPSKDLPSHTTGKEIIKKGKKGRNHPELVAGSCFIVGAPIGEEDDFTQRGVRTLQSANIIVSPDEKGTARLLKRFSIAKPLLGIGEELTDEVSAEVLERLHKGERVAIMSASTLFLTEPVRLLANRVRREGLEPRVIPGVDLVMMALLMSGFPTDRYFVAGFIPTRKEPREEFVRSLSERPETAVVFASAPRLTSTLAGLGMKMPERNGAVILKPTVPGEIALRGTVRELREHLASKMLSGTATIVLGPQGEGTEEAETQETAEERSLMPQEETETQEIAEERPPMPPLEEHGEQREQQSTEEERTEKMEDSTL